jgi:hypothetical protein
MESETWIDRLVNRVDRVRAEVPAWTLRTGYHTPCGEAASNASNEDARSDDAVRPRDPLARP